VAPKVKIERQKICEGDLLLMRILIYGLNYAPEPTGIGKYTGEMGEWLQKQGEEIRVITAFPYYPAWKIQQEYLRKSYVREESHGIRITRCPLWVPHQVSGLKRLLHLASFATSSFPLILWQSMTWKPQVVIVVAPAFFCVVGGWLGSWLSRGKAWLHIQDFEVDAAFDLGLLPAFLRPLALFLERWLLRRFDRVSTIAHHMVERLEHKGLSKERVVFFPNWVDTETIYPLTGDSPFRAELGIRSEQIVVLYSGNMGQKQGLEIVAEAAQQLAAQSESVGDILFVLCGDGPSRSLLEESTQGLSNVRFLPLQPKERLNDLLNLADIHLVPQRADAADSVMPSKLTGILACGGAVIATAYPETELAEVVQAAQGLICAPGDSQALATLIVRLAQSPEDRQRMSRQAREYAVQHWSLEAVLSQFYEALLEVHA
jgi:colanic acid biosynthesis glycosyl transferase WcaI